MNRIMIALLAVFALLIGNEQANAEPLLVVSSRIWMGTVADTASVRGVPAGVNYYATDTKKTYISNGTGWLLNTVAAKSDTSALTAPGAFKAFGASGYSQATFVIQQTNATTSGTYKFQGKVTDAAWTLNSGWFNLDAENDSTVFAGNDIFARSFSFPACLDSIRAYFWSEAGGTGTTPIVKYSFANPSK